MKLSNKYPLECIPGPRDNPHRLGSGSGYGPLDYESRDPVPDPETLPFKYIFGQISFYRIKKKKKKENNQNKQTKNKTKQNKKTKKKKKKKNKTKNKNERHGSLVVSAHTGLRC